VLREVALDRPIGVRVAVKRANIGGNVQAYFLETRCEIEGEGGVIEVW
jgi:hypothetical protein